MRDFLEPLVELRADEQAEAEAEGRRRFARNRSRLDDKLGARGRAMGDRPDILGAGGELAVCLWLEVAWDEALITHPGRRPDVAGVSVRARDVRSDQRLPVRDRDLRHRTPILLVVADPPRYTIAGWIWPEEATRPEWRDDPGGYGLPAFMVPRQELHDPYSLPSKPRPLRPLAWVTPEAALAEWRSLGLRA